MGKRLHKEQNLELKYKALLDLEKGKTNKEVAQLFGVPANTLSTWKKNKDKRVKVDTYDQVNRAVLKRFKMLRCENVPANTLRKSNAILGLYFVNSRKLLSANVDVTQT